MAGKVLTEEDFKEGADTGKDTSSETFTSDQKLGVDGKPIEEPEKEVTPAKEEGGKEPLPKPSEGDKKYKYETLDAFDKAYHEAEKKMHESTTEASELRKKLAQYEKPLEKPKTLDDQIKEMTKETLNKIKVLPVDSPTRDEDAGYLWSKLSSDITDIKYEERTRHADTERTIVTKTYERATKEGIKTDAELRILGYEFSKTDFGLSTDDRINQAIESTKGVLSQIREGFVVDQEKDKKEKDNLRVLGRGSSRTKTTEKEEVKSTTMSQQLAELHEKRRMTKEDLRY